MPKALKNKPLDDGGFETLVKQPSAPEVTEAAPLRDTVSLRKAQGDFPIKPSAPKVTEAAGITGTDWAAETSLDGEPARLASGPSLKARAVGYLSRREHARNELARKLHPYAQDPSEVEAVLDALQREGWQSNERFAHGLVHRRAPLRGTARIVQELKQHGVDDAFVAEASAQLKATELDRARAVWAKRYDARPVDRNEYARQARFLAGRGFSPEVIRRVLGDAEDEA